MMILTQSNFDYNCQCCHCRTWMTLLMLLQQKLSKANIVDPVVENILEFIAE